MDREYSYVMLSVMWDSELKGQPLKAGRTHIGKICGYGREQVLKYKKSDIFLRLEQREWGHFLCWVLKSGRKENKQH